LWDLIAVLASGPSLTREDAIAVRDAGFRTIVVNSTWKLAPWYDVLYAGDARWWRAYGEEVKGNGKWYTRALKAQKQFGAKVARTRLPGAYNSGELAVELACRKNPKLVVLLGFDASVKHGIHHHGPHQKTPNPNPTRAKRWHPQFKQLAEVYKHVPIVNCSRYTELDCFPKLPLEDVLCEPFSISAILSQKDDTQ
jgi:hypothetical protein